MKNFYILFVALFILDGAIGHPNQRCVPCLPAGIAFSTQAQIDNFQTNYPNCTQIEGFVSICGSDIINLNGLNVLTSIGGHFTICLTNLINLSGLDSLTTIGGLFNIGQFNNSLTSLMGLEGLTSIGGALYIGNNPVLTSLTGLNNVTSIGGELKIEYNDALTNLMGMEGLASIEEDFWIWDNNNLTTLTGVEGLTSIDGSLMIEINAALTSLTGLEGVTSVGGVVGIYHNPALTSLSGLGGLIFIGGLLGIINNDTLTSLMGLDNIDAGSITDLDIYDNKSLSSCETQSICDYLASPSSTIEIHDNADGCNNKEQVDSACAVMFVENLIYNDAFSIYPNPASSNITISTPNKGNLSILTLNGQQLLQQEITEPNTTIYVSGLKSGIYFVRVTGERTVQVGKFLKK